LLGDENDLLLYHLIESRNFGSLIVPSKDVVRICKMTDRHFRLFKEHLSSAIYVLLQKQIPLQMALKASELRLFQSLIDDHISDLRLMSSHVLELVKAISYSVT
jgi:hypothetical protein